MALPAMPPSRKNERARCTSSAHPSQALVSLYTRHWGSGEPPSTSMRGTLGGAAAFLTMGVCMPLENVCGVCGWVGGGGGHVHVFGAD